MLKVLRCPRCVGGLNDVPERSGEQLKNLLVSKTMWPITLSTPSANCWPQRCNREFYVHKFRAVLRVPGVGERQF
jgi:hypothetical protein